ncbi:MAG: hypothetical protein R3C18_22705 [Planctomycetaceae bacterium]
MNLRFNKRDLSALWRHTSGALALGTLLWSSSCSSLDRWTAADKIPVAPHIAERAKAGQSATEVQRQRLLAELSQVEEQAATQTNDPFARAEATRTQVAKVSQKQQLVSAERVAFADSPRVDASTALAAANDQAFAAWNETRQPVQDSNLLQVSAEQAAGGVFVNSDEGTAFCPPASPPQFCPPQEVVCPTCPPFAWAAPEAPDFSADEYICDGGDKNLPVHYDGNVRQGLDVEDTVVEYMDSRGEMHVRPSTKACVYSPRFGSVRSITQPNERYHVMRATGAHDSQGAGGLAHRMGHDEQVQRDEFKDVRSRSRASGVDQKTVDAVVSRDLKAENHAKVLNVYESFAFFREGVFDRVDSAVMSDGIGAALAWSSGQPPIVQGHFRSGYAVQGRVYAQEEVGVESRGLPADVQISKVADKKTALSGEEVTFTIRLDNLGDENVLDFRLIDHLSPRLQYVDGTVDSNLPGKLDVENDGAGGQVLTFQFTGELAGRSGGWVSFTCVVR